MDFSYETSRIYTVSQKQYNKIKIPEIDLPENLYDVDLPKMKEEEAEFGYLVIDSFFELEKYDSLGEGSAKIQPALLVIYGIIAFLTGVVFNSYQSFSQQSGLLSDLPIFPSKNILKKGEEKFSDDLKILLLTIAGSTKEKQVLIFSLFERWRKALYLEQKSKDSGRFNDEAILAYVHILEVLSDEYKADLVKALRDKRLQLKNDLILAVQKNELGTVDNILSALSVEYVTLRDKIFHLLDKFDLSDEKTKAIVVRFIKHRNDIAHGKRDIYQSKMIFPLIPFFSLIKDVDERIDAVKFLAGVCLSKYLGTTVWYDDWDFLLMTEFAPISEIKDFIKNEEFNTISDEEFLSVTEDCITPTTLSYYYLKKKIRFSDLERSLQKIILSSPISKNFCNEILDAAIALSDSAIKPLAAKCQEIIKEASANYWHRYSNIRDAIKYFEFHEIEVNWFRGFLIDRASRNI
ncbi:hypothetical protein [Ferruginibacter sp. HRS2-29]|uniref:hypothetical protein n=1 Tax=Ferruginibacter sp. HRS2-29 TaxID=2487334 RepID=UPI0020CD727D|nr:hypothetical protein [Ferruginibacter sp. HRS2-29]MCP9750006.1 hypothetical protein [Ferruginibacter sp. HRS2-29]